MSAVTIRRKTNYNPNNFKLTELTVQEFQKLIKSKTPVTVPMLKYTPELAGVFLSNLGDNRTPVDSTSLAHRDLILAGGYEYAGSNNGMGTRVDGTTANGANRSTGLVEAAKVDPEVFIVTDFTFGLPQNSIKGIDQNRARTMADHLEMFEGLSRGEAQLAAAVCRQIQINLKNNHRQKVLSATAETVFRDFQKGLRILPQLKGNLRRSERAAAVVVAAQANFDKIQAFIQACNNSTAGALVNGAQITNYVNNPQNNDKPDVQFRKVLDGLMSYLDGKDRLRLQGSSGHENLLKATKAGLRGRAPVPGGVLEKFLLKASAQEDLDS